MAKVHQIAGALMAVVGLNAPAQGGLDPASRHYDLYLTTRTASTVVQADRIDGAANDSPVPANTAASAPATAAPLVLSCKTQGMWKSIPDEDSSAMGQLGKRLCTDQNFTTALPEAGTTRDKYFSQLSLAHRHLSQLAQLGRAVQGGDLTDANLPNMYVVEKPNAAPSGRVVYQFELTLRQPTSEGGSPLAEEQVNGTTRTGKLTGLLEIAPAPAKSVARLTH